MMDHPLRTFEERQIRPVREWAEAGGQALHLFNPRTNWPWDDPAVTPRCFREAARCGELWAHLFDLDVERLQAAARRFGVRVVKLHGRQPPYHVDLCGKPLQRALKQAEKDTFHRTIEDAQFDLFPEAAR